ncbi:MAG: hypothetical protein Fur0043_21690 [Anaerolineales bacterium]
MDNLFNLLLLVLFGIVSVLAFFAALTLLLPAPIEKTRQMLEANGGRALLLGLVNFIFFGMIVLLCLWLAEKVGGVVAGIFILIGGLVTLALAALAIIGLVALAQLLGTRMGSETTPFLTTLRGGGVLLLAGLAPYVGWFLFAPLAVWAGLGAAIQSVISRRKTPLPAEP